jgi:hypothetical protein
MVVVSGFSRTVVIHWIGRLAGICRSEPTRAPALGASGSYAFVAAAINS